MSGLELVGVLLSLFLAMLVTTYLTQPTLPAGDEGHELAADPEDDLPVSPRPPGWGRW